MKLPKTIEEVREFMGEDNTLNRKTINTNECEYIIWDYQLLEKFQEHKEKHKKKSKWIKWEGGDCPVPGDTRVKVKFEDGYKIGGYSAEFWYWGWSNPKASCIIAYKVIEGKK